MIESAINSVRSFTPRSRHTHRRRRPLLCRAGNATRIPRTPRSTPLAHNQPRTASERASPSGRQVRFSIKIKQLDEMDRILAHKFARFLMQRAENFIILRRKPLPVRRHATARGPLDT